MVANGTSVTGTAEAGSTITITGSNGTVLGTGVADGSGNFSIVITPAQVGGETLQVVAQTGLATSERQAASKRRLPVCQAHR